MNLSRKSLPQFGAANKITKALRSGDSEQLLHLLTLLYNTFCISRTLFNSAKTNILPYSLPKLFHFPHCSAILNIINKADLLARSQCSTHEKKPPSAKFVLHTPGHNHLRSTSGSARFVPARCPASSMSHRSISETLT